MSITYIIKTTPRADCFRPLVEEIAHNGLPVDAREVYESRNRIVAITTAEGEEINIKSFHRPHPINARVYTTLRQGKALRSFLHALRLIKLGFDTPEPIAYAECRDGLRLLDSYYLSRQIAATTMREPQQYPFEKQLLEALGHEMARLHRAAVWMRDFSPGNVLFEEDATAQHGYRFYYVDLNRMAFDVTDRRKLMLMFHSIMEHEYQVEIIARAYAADMNFDPDATAAEAVRLHRQFWRRHLRKKRLKRKLLFWKR